MFGDALLKRLFGTSKERGFKRYKPLLDAVASHEPRIAAMTNDEMRVQTAVFRKRLAEGATLDDILPESFAVVRETSKRVLGMRPFDVQVLGAIVLHEGKIAEMVTGEGKTLVATMPLYLNALSGKGVHLVTVNDYLARRDSQWMGPVFEFLGLTVGLIQQGMDTAERQVAYRSDITYGTNSEIGFDYLRDNMAVRVEHCVQRELHFAIVDEVDSILIDEARTPLIISGRPEKSTDLYYKVDEAVCKMRDKEHYEVEEKGRHASLTEDGMAAAERLLGVHNLYTDDSLGLVHMIEQSLRAHHFYKKDDEYVVNNGDVVIIDEFTGRLMEGRRFGDGLHQAIEAKERVPVQFETQTVATISYQNLFKLYKKLAGMTGTAMTEANEFMSTYKLEVVQVPTNLPMRRADRTDLIFASEKGKFNYVIKEIETMHATGRPVLVGTVSIEKSEHLATLLRERGIKEFQVLNAKYHEREAAIISNAGKKSAVTIATNMAGRGTDIKLAEGVRELGGLAIIGTERHESRRIDNQLRGRAGRQGDPGTTRFYVSLEDEVARLFGGDRIKRIIAMLGGEAMDEEPLDQRMVTRSIERAQRQVEEYNFEIRKNLLKYDDVMNKQREVIYKMRRDVLDDRDITEQLQEMSAELVYSVVDEYAPKDVPADEWDLDGMMKRLKVLYSEEFSLEGHTSGTPDAIAETFIAQIHEEYVRREALIAGEIRESFREQIGGDDSAIDFAKLARKRVHDFEKMALLNAVDSKWIDHLFSMDYLRESVRLRALGQRDPLLDYKQESFELFEQLLVAIYETTIQTLFRVTDPEVRKRHSADLQRAAATAQESDPFAQLSRYQYVAAAKEQDRSFASFDTSRFRIAQQATEEKERGGNVQTMERAESKPKIKPVRRTEPKVKPNDPCPCGSGKKYKKCHGATTS
jgi:preprotein translocase subunit SecA